MKNIVKAFTAEQTKRHQDYIADVKKWEKLPYNVKLTPAKQKLSFSDQKEFLIKKHAEKINKEISQFTEFMNSDQGELVEAKITIEWKRNRTWGSNPTASCDYEYKVNNVTRWGSCVSGSISGCGYDKQSTAVANVLNQIESLKQQLYNFKSRNVETSNRELLGYGSGYGLLPRFEGGVGVSCYPAIFEKLGYTFQTIVNTKTVDVYKITKK